MIEEGSEAELKPVNLTPRTWRTCTVPIETKISIIFGVPCIAANILMILFLSMNADTIITLNNLQNQMDLVTKLSDLQHSIQSERGMSAVFLSTGGTIFINELRKTRSETDSKRMVLQDFLVPYPRKNLPSPDVWDQFREQLNNLQKHRDDVLLLNVTSSFTLEFYTKLTGLMIASIASLASSSSSPSSFRDYYFFSAFKDCVGLERAYGGTAFATKGWTSMKSYSLFMKQVAAQDTYLTILDRFSGSDIKKRTMELLSNNQNPIISITSNMREELMENSSKLSVIEPASWFSNMSAKMNLMKGVQDVILMKMEEGIDNDKIKSTSNIAIISSCCALLVLLCIIMILWLVREMVALKKDLLKAELMANYLANMELSLIPKKPNRPTTLENIMYKLVEKMEYYKPYLPSLLLETQSKCHDQPLIENGDVSGGECVRESVCSGSTLLTPVSFGTGSSHRGPSIMTVLIADVCDFHSYMPTSNSKHTNSLRTHHTHYITTIESVVKSCMGSFNYFTGDKVLVSWDSNRTVSRNNHLACKAALAIVRILESQGIRIFMSICSGKAVHGFYGSASSKSYAIFGNFITLAYRLIPLNKLLCTRILVDGTVALSAQQEYQFRMVDRVIANMNTAVPIYQLQGDVVSDTDEWIYNNSATSTDPVNKRAMNAFMMGSIPLAIKLFEESLMQSNDNVTYALLDRARDCLSKTVPKNSSYSRRWLGWAEGEWIQMTNSVSKDVMEVIDEP